MTLKSFLVALTCIHMSLSLQLLDAQPVFHLESKIDQLLALPEVKKALGESNAQTQLTAYFLTSAVIGKNFEFQEIIIAILILTLNSIYSQTLKKLDLEAEFRSFVEDKKVYEERQAIDLKTFVEDAKSLRSAYAGFFKKCSKKSELPDENELLDALAPEIKEIVHLIFKKLF